MTATPQMLKKEPQVMLLIIHIQQQPQYVIIFVLEPGDDDSDESFFTHTCQIALRNTLC